MSNLVEDQDRAANYQQYRRILGIFKAASDKIETACQLNKITPEMIEHFKQTETRLSNIEGSLVNRTNNA